MSTTFRRFMSKETVNTKEVNKQEKLISLYNQLNGTDYDLNSVGIELVHKVKSCTGNRIHSSKPDVNFGWYTRTGVAYSNHYTDREKKELQCR